MNPMDQKDHLFSRLCYDSTSRDDKLVTDHLGE